jgi:hypothetical protein
VRNRYRLGISIDPWGKGGKRGKGGKGPLHITQLGISALSIIKVLPLGALSSSTVYFGFIVLAHMKKPSFLQ